MRSRGRGLPILALLFAGRVALAQTTGNLEGVVADAGSSPLPGAVVEARSPSLIGRRVAVTDEEGRFRIRLLSPGVYSLGVSLTGFGDARAAGVRVTLGGTVSVAVTLAASGSSGSAIAVPEVDLARTDIGLVASADTILGLPLGRDFVSIAETVAGVGSDVSGNAAVHGASGLENRYLLDGLDTTGGRIGTRGIRLPTEFVREVQVITAAAGSEQGRAMGGTINAITRSGGNEYHGDAFGYHEPRSPRKTDVGLTLGGYAVKDRLWIFGGYDRVDEDQDLDAGDGRGDLFAAKLTSRLGDGHRLTGSAFGDAAGGGADVSLKYDGVLDARTVVEAQYGHHRDKLFDETSRRDSYRVVAGTFLGDHETRVGVDWERLGGGGPAADNVAFFFQERWRIRSNVTVTSGLRYETQSLKDAAGATRLTLKDEWSPRLAVAWDVLGNGRSKAFASYGRFYEVIPQDVQSRALGSSVIAEDLEGMFQDEFLVGGELWLGRGWSAGVTGIYRSLGRVLEDRCDLAVNPDVSRYAADPGVTCALINPGQARRKFRGLELTAAHRVSGGFYLLASYLLSKLEGNYSGTLSDTREAGQLHPSTNADFDFPGLVVNSYGRLKNDRTHQLKVSGVHAFPFGVTLGVTGLYASGRPVSIRGCAPDRTACLAGYDEEGYLVPRGSAGRLPSLYEASVHVQYTRRFGAVTVTPVVDVFNVLDRRQVTARDELFNDDGTLAGNDPRSRIGRPGCTAANATLFNAACASNPGYGKDVAWQSPRTVRLGLRISY